MLTRNSNTWSESAQVGARLSDCQTAIFSFTSRQISLDCRDLFELAANIEAEMLYFVIFRIFLSLSLYHLYVYGLNWVWKYIAGNVICCLHCFINNILDIIRQYDLTDLAFLLRLFLLRLFNPIKISLGKRYSFWCPVQGQKKKREPFNLYWHFFFRRNLGIFQPPLGTLIRGKESFGFSCLLINQRLWETNHISVKATAFLQRIYSFSLSLNLFQFQGVLCKVKVPSSGNICTIKLIKWNIYKKN